jgi:hypothetical protein
LGQVSALALYAALYWTLIRPYLATQHGAINRYLSSGFPAAHQNLLVFGARATLKQFAYAFSSVILGPVAACLFVAALIILWKGRSPGEQTRNRTFAILLVVPFFLACAGALLKIHPYGRSRHTVILCLFAAAGVSIPLERIFRSRPWIAGCAALTLASVWTVAATPDPHNIPPSRDRRASMAAAIDYLKGSIPPGSLVLADEETAMYLRFYLPDKQELRLQTDFDRPEGPPVGSFRVIWRRWDFGEVDDFLEDLASVRSEFGLNRDAPVWIVDGGFEVGIDARLRRRFPAVSLPALHDFDGALTVFQTPPGI